ncbi:hypothetical protein AB0910_26900 [Streptomyces sp. NPDC047002]|uniref:hypothetical protein n=1 Tax=Streptomyces sp. NPDC047002 TaxID=3155475 RepID=UPI0034566DD9
MADTLWIHYALPRTAWYVLDEAEQRAARERWAAVREASLAAGATTTGPYTVRGQSDFSTAEVWTFPDADAAWDHWERLTAAGYARWFETANNLGTRAGAS